MKIVRPKSLKELVVDEVRARIVDGRMKLGGALSENALAAELGISKTPVREALLQLQSEGLVEVVPQRGTFVFRLDPRQVVQISELREALETAAVAWAVKRNHGRLVEAMTALCAEMEKAQKRGDHVRYHEIDGRYHQAMIELADNPYLLDAYDQIGSRIQALRSRLSLDAMLNSRSLADHRRMLELVREKKVKQLQGLLVTHIAHTRQWYLEVLGDGPAEADLSA